MAYDLLIYLYNFVTSENFAISPKVYVMNDTVFTPGVVGGPTGEGDLDVQLAQGLGKKAQMKNTLKTSS